MTNRFGRMRTLWGPHGAMRLRLLQAPENFSAVSNPLPLTEWQKQELDRRLAEFEADPDDGPTLEVVFARIRRAS